MWNHGNLQIQQIKCANSNVIPWWTLWLFLLFWRLASVSINLANFWLIRRTKTGLGKTAQVKQRYQLRTPRHRTPRQTTRMKVNLEDCLNFKCLLTDHLQRWIMLCSTAFLWEASPANLLTLLEKDSNRTLILQLAFLFMNFGWSDRTELTVVPTHQGCTFSRV